MAASPVMQHETQTAERPRFAINGHGELIDRHKQGMKRRTGYNMIAHHVTRTEMQILADLLNEPDPMRDWDAGHKPDWIWARRIGEHERAQFVRNAGRTSCTSFDAIRTMRRQLEATHAG